MDKPKPKAAKPPEHVEVFYNTQDGSYLYNLGGEYVCLKLGDVRRHMRALGLSEMNYFDGQRECDWPMYHAQVARRVHYAGPLGGHRIGTFVDGSNRRYLVTEEARGVWDKLPAKVNEPKFFCAFLQELLPGEQAERVCYWLAIALDSLRKQDYRPGQVSVFAGPVQCGKSLFQYITTEILGGRAGNPMRYMMEETTFNDDLAGTEHWMIEEPKSSVDIRTRLAFGNAIKECFTNRDFSIHPKGKRATPLPLARRGSISVNDEPELLQVLPPFNGSVDDKINLFHCCKVTEAFAPFRDEKSGRMDRLKLWATVLEEIPMIRAWLLKAFRVVPKALRDDRFGIVAYHNPELLSYLSAYAPEVRLMELIDLILFNEDNALPWTGRSIHLEEVLRGHKLAFEVDKVLKGSNKIGTYLARLAKSRPERVSSVKVNGHSRWTITTPGKED